MNDIIKGFFIVLLTAVLLPFSPWYIGVLIAAIICFINPSKIDFLLGFICVAAVWLAYILYFHFSNDGLVTQKMATLLSSGLGSWLSAPILIILSAFIGGLLGGLGALSGSLLRSSFSPTKSKSKLYKLKLS